MEEITIIRLGDYEASRYADEIAEALDKGGVQVSFFDIGSASPPVYGLRVRKSDAEYPVIQRLREADFDIEIVDFMPLPGSAHGMPRPILFVGLKASRL